MHGRQPPESGIEHRKLKGIYGSLDVIAGRAVVFPAVDILRAQGGGWPHFDFAAGFMRHRLYSSKAGCGVGRRHITAWAKRRPILLFSSDAAGRTPPLPMPCKAAKHCDRVAFQHALHCLQPRLLDLPTWGLQRGWQVVMGHGS